MSPNLSPIGMHAAQWEIRRTREPRGRGERWLALFLVLAGHLAALFAVLSYAPAREALAEAMPIMVSLLPTPTEPVIESPKPAPRSPAASAAAKPRAAPAPREPMAERAAEPASAPALAPVMPLSAAPIPTPAPAVAAVAPAQPVQPPTAPVSAPAPLTPPRFDAAYLDNPAPSYPALSRRLREQGRVMLRVLVNPGGAPERIEVRASSGSERLDHAAEDTVRRWRFVPARQGAQAVPAWVLVPISFNLEG